MPSPVVETLRGAYSIGFNDVMAVGDAGTIVWTAGGTVRVLDSGTTRRLNAVTLADLNIYVVVGDAGTILTKARGIEVTKWTARASPTTMRLAAVAAESGVVLAVGENGTALRSINGIDWTPQSTGHTGPLTGAAAGKGVFVVAAAHPTLLVSIDGALTFQTITLEAHGPVGGVSSVVFGGNRFYVSGANGIYASTDGVNWHWIGGGLATGDSVTGAAYFDGALLSLINGDDVRDELGNTYPLGGVTGWRAIAAGGSLLIDTRAFVVGTGGRIAWRPQPLRAAAVFPPVVLPAATISVVDPNFRPNLTGSPVIEPLPDGRSYVGGAALTFDVNGQTQRGIARLTRQGAIDGTFNPGAGLDFTAPSREVSIDADVRGVSLVPQGNQIVAFFHVSYGIRSLATTFTPAGRFNFDGSRDASFQPEGHLRRTVNRPVLLADGRWIAVSVGRNPEGNRTVRLTRHSRDGVTDQDYGDRVLTPLEPAPVASPDGNGQVDPLNYHVLRTVDPLGRVYLGIYYDFLPFFREIGESSRFGQGKTMLLRLNPDGTPDASFAVRSLPQLSTLQATSRGLLCQSRERQGPDLLKTTFRLTFEGERDAAFHSSQILSFQGSFAFTEVATLPDGSHLALRNDPAGNRGIVRFDANGDRDPTLYAEFGAAAGSIHILVPASDQTIYVGGAFTSIGGVSQGILARVTPRTHFATTRLSNLSVRARTETGAGTLIGGFITHGSSTNVLVRAAGPALAVFGVSGLLTDPQLALFSGNELLAANDDWNSPASAALAAASARLDAFPFSTTSKDAALLARIGSGGFTTQVTSANSSSGAALLEIFHNEPAPTDATSSRLINLSARATAGAAAETLIAGFTIQGEFTRNILIRAVGPGLGKFGVPGVLGNPALTLYRGNIAIAQNDNWETAPSATITAVRNAMNAANAFPLESGSMDAALTLTLPGGQYTAHVTGPNGTSGVVLVEIYDVP